MRFAIALGVLIVSLTAAPALGAEPSPSADPSPAPSPPVLIDPLDPRAGAGANRVGAPLLALVVVLAAGAIAAAGTVAYVRVTRRR